eukprot:2731436-Prymnesium_polylepis.1
MISSLCEWPLSQTWCRHAVPTRKRRCCSLRCGPLFQPDQPPRASLSSSAGCEGCTVGHWCTPGTERPEPCKAGRYGATAGQTNSECSGECSLGHYCEEGSTSSTYGVC